MLFRRRFDVNVVTMSNQNDDFALASMRRGEMTREPEFKSIWEDLSASTLFCLRTDLNNVYPRMSRRERSVLGE